MIDDIRKLVLLHPTRTGGTSVETMLSDGRVRLSHNIDDRLLEHGFRFFGGRKQHFRKMEMGEWPPDYIAFVTVRNPFCRAASIKAYNLPNKSVEENIRIFSNNGILQAEYTCDAQYMVRMCDGERENVDWLESVTSRKLVHVNARPPQLLTQMDIDFVRKYFEEDFKYFAYDINTVPSKLIG